MPLAESSCANEDAGRITHYADAVIGQHSGLAWSSSHQVDNHDNVPLITLIRSRILVSGISAELTKHYPRIYNKIKSIAQDLRQHITHSYPFNCISIVVPYTMPDFVTDAAAGFKNADAYDAYRPSYRP